MTSAPNHRPHFRIRYRLFAFTTSYANDNPIMATCCDARREMTEGKVEVIARKKSTRKHSRNLQSTFRIPSGAHATQDDPLAKATKRIRIRSEDAKVRQARLPWQIL